MPVFAGTTLVDLDQGMIDKFGGSFTGTQLLSSNVLVDAAPVELFIEMPDTDEVVDRVFPSVSFELVGIEPARDRLESRYDNRYTNVTATTRDLLPDPEPYDIRYAVHTWSRNVLHDRQLIDRILAVLLINDTVTSSAYEWELQRDPMLVADRFYKDQKIYHKVWPVVVYTTHLSDIPTRTDIPIALENHMNFYRNNLNDFECRIVNDGTTTTIETTPS